MTAPSTALPTASAAHVDAGDLVRYLDGELGADI